MYGGVLDQQIIYDLPEKFLRDHAVVESDEEKKLRTLEILEKNLG